MAWDKNGNLHPVRCSRIIYRTADAEAPMEQVVELPAPSLSHRVNTNGTRILDWDDENQLIRVTEPGSWKSEFVYDGKMRRRVRAEFTWNAGAWVTNQIVRYVYDGNLVLQERNEFNVPVKTYTRGLDLSGSLEGAGGIGGLLAVTLSTALSSQPTSYYYHADGNGNVTCLLDGNQRVAARYLYDPFGNTLSASGPAADLNLYRFSSKELHVASGLVYYLYRFYEPSLQRWPNRDPIREPGFEQIRQETVSTLGDGPNLYLFAHDNPINRIDALGLDDADDLENCQKRCHKYCEAPGIPSPQECLKNCYEHCDENPNAPPNPLPPTPPCRPKLPEPDLWPLFKQIIKDIWKSFRATKK